MKYLILIYGNDELWASFAPEDMAEHIAAQDAWNTEFSATGELLGAYGLGSELQAKTVRVRDGVPAITDGPYLEAKEYIGSYYMIDVESEERAMELAALIPFAAVREVEVWPVLHEAGDVG